jgi:hypothetical protein
MSFLVYAKKDFLAIPKFAKNFTKAKTSYHWKGGRRHFDDLSLSKPSLQVIFDRILMNF